MTYKDRPKRRLRPANFIESLESRTLLSSGPQVIGYLPDYEFSHFSSIDLGALTQLNYFAVAANSSGALSTTSSSGFSLSQLQTVVAAAHSAPSRVNVSITIDPGSAFQAIADSSSATSAFVTNVMAFISTYHLDGVDLDYEPQSALTTAQMNSYGNLLATLHAQTSANGLILSAAVQVSQMIIPKAYLSDIDRYLVMDYDLEFNSSSPYSESLTYLNNWANYAVPNGVPKSDLFMGVPFYGRAGTSWGNSQTETYAQILAAYASSHGGAFPAANVDSVTIGTTTWGFNGPTTMQNKVNYVLQNGYGGMMIWELGQDYFAGGAYTAQSLVPAIKSVIGAASETWTGHVSNAWNTAGNWNFGTVPGSTTNVVLNSGSASATSPITVASLTLNGGTLSLPEGVSTTQSLSINNSAALNLGAGILVINYGTSPDPISTIRGYLTTGSAGGAWNGAGIMSTVAQANSGSYGLGYADSADAGNPAGLTTQTIEVQYTLLGDADLNGIVNGIDFGIVAANFNKGVTAWDQGDFNYDNIVNGIDFGYVAANFNLGVSLPSSAVTTTVATSIPTSTPASTSGGDSTNSNTKAVSATPSSKHAHHRTPKHHSPRA